jgi:hypothetical protein
MHLDTKALKAIISMRHGIDDGLLPGEGGIGPPFLKEEIHQPLALGDKGLDGTIGFLDQADQGSLYTNALDDVQLGAGPALGAFPSNQLNPTTGMPAGGIFREEEHGGQGQAQPAVDLFGQPVVNEELLRGKRDPAFMRQLLNQGQV